ncbi:putative non-specific serine/threonine protein kinase [Helianthus anomalus]
MTLEECSTKCLDNCTCMAYANQDTYCLLWLNDLLDIQVLPKGRDGHDILVRMASSELGNNV